MSSVKLYHGDCLTILPQIASSSVDAVITDPPYPEISRSYGRWTVEEWWTLIVEGVIPQVRRILKPTGSAVFILQPNSEHVGQMRGWLWEFMAWVCREWNMVQDVWWWNLEGPPSVHASQYGLLRGKIKSCVWIGSSDCYRNQEKIMWSESQSNKAYRLRKRFCREANTPSGWDTDYKRCSMAAGKKGGLVTPYNILLCGTDGFRKTKNQKENRHGACTPLKLADWWTRYIVPPGGVVCDPFAGSGTMGLAALQNDCSFIGVEKEITYVEVMRQRIDGFVRKGPEQTGSREYSYLPIF